MFIGARVKRKELALTLIFALLIPITNSLIIDEAAGAFYPEQPGEFSISILAPIDQAKVTTEHFTLTFNLSVPPAGDMESLSYMIDNNQISINPDSYITAEISGYYGFGGYHTDSSNYTYSINVNAVGLSDAWHTVQVTVSGPVAYRPDPSQPLLLETAEKINLKSTRFLLDVFAPKISIISPQNQTYTNSNQNLNFTLSKLANWIGYSIDGQPPTTITGNTTLTGLSEGTHNVTVYANDTTGREGNSETVYFSIAKEEGQNPPQEQEPFPTALILAISGLFIAVVVAAALLVYFKKRKR